MPASRFTELLESQGLAPLYVVLFLIVLLGGLTFVPFRYNLRNLLVRWVMSLITALAFTLVVGLLVVMLAFVNGMNRLTENSGNPGNVMILADGATDELFSRLPPFSVEELPSYVRQFLQKDEKGRYLVSAEVYVLVKQDIKYPIPDGPQRRFIQIRGVRDPEMSARVHDLELLSGTWLSPSGTREVKELPEKDNPAIEALMGEGVAKVIGDDYFGRPLQPGDTVPIGPRMWYVVGVLRSSGSTFGSEIWARDQLIQETFGKRNAYSVYVARTAGAEYAAAASKLLKQEKVQGVSLQVYTEREYFANLNRTNQQFAYSIYFVAVVMAVGGIFGVMNTMFAAISQRAKDIGVLRLLGYTRLQIMCSFLLESLVLALFGGLLGCSVALLVDGATATSIASSGAGGAGKSVVLRLTVDGGIIATGLVFSLAMGLIGGFLPALSAMRLKPLESLR